MSYFVLTLLGAFAGAISVYLILESKRRSLQEWRTELEEKAREYQRLNLEKAEFAAERKTFEAKAVKYEELQGENLTLKRDLQNIDVNLRKLQMDGELQAERQVELDRKGTELAKRFLKDSIKLVGSSLNANNYGSCKQKLQKVIDWCRGVGYEITDKEESKFLEDLKADYEKAVRVAFEREEQARIRAQIRDEQKREKEIEREMQRIEQEKKAIEAALEKALAETKDEHSAEVERLKAKLAEAEEKARRTVSQAQLTRSGHVYVISNIGSFGEKVFKIGMTRRLEPMDRVKELGDASVPFPFDVHMMISSNDAPALENALHKEFHNLRLNKTNPRKEFFRVDLDEIRKIVEKECGEVEYVADAEALEYRQSLSMSDEDLEFIESTFEAVVGADGDGEYED